MTTENEQEFPRAPVKRRVIPIFEEPHFCPDWDYMLICPGDEALGSCTCGSNGVRVKKGDKVRTYFYKNQSNVIRTVSACYKAPIPSQTGWYIETEDGLACDSGWFREV